MRKRKHHIVLGLTQQAVEAWFEGRLSLIEPLLDEQADFLGPLAGPHLRGRLPIVAMMRQAGRRLRPCHVIDQRYELVSWRGSCLVSGSYTVLVDDGEMTVREEQRLTLVWCLTQGAWHIVHIQAAVVTAALAEFSGRPDLPQQRVMDMLQDQLGLDRQMMAVTGADGRRHQFMRFNVSHLEAADEYVIIHLPQTVIRVHDRLYRLAASQFPDFVRIHRSYYINPCSIRIRRPRSVQMIDGSELPVSDRGRQNLAALPPGSQYE